MPASAAHAHAQAHPGGAHAPAAAAPVQLPAAPPREAKPWSAEEDSLIVEMHAARAQCRETHLTYQSIAATTGRSANAVKCRWQNKLKELHAAT